MKYFLRGTSINSFLRRIALLRSARNPHVLYVRSGFCVLCASHFIRTFCIYRSALLFTTVLFGLSIRVNVAQAQTTPSEESQGPSLIRSWRSFGYVEGTLGRSTEEARAACFGLPQGMGSYSLGNSCGAWAGVGVEVNSRRFAGGRWLQLTGAVDYTHTSEGSLEYLNNNNQTNSARVSQAWLGLYGLGAKSNVWVGRRNYRPHILPNYGLNYWGKNSFDTVGGGIENIAVGQAGTSLHVALLHKQNPFPSTNLVGPSTQQTANMLDVQLDNIPLWQHGSLSVMGDLRQVSEHRANADVIALQERGWAFAAEYQHKDFELPILGKAYTSLVWERSNNAAVYFNEWAFTNDAQSTQRLLNYWWTQPHPRVELMATLAIQESENSSKNTQNSARSWGVQGAWNWRTHYSSMVELGGDQMRYDDGSVGRLMKYTLVPLVWHIDQAWVKDRSEVRFFVTQANWNQEANSHANLNQNLVGRGVFANSSKTQATTFGAQMRWKW